MLRRARHCPRKLPQPFAPRSVLLLGLAFAPIPAAAAAAQPSPSVSDSVAVTQQQPLPQQPLPQQPQWQQPQSQQLAILQQGEYLTRIAGCVACHSDPAQPERFLAGGAAIETPFGRFYPPNITPDVETGIGGWTDQQFLQAMQHGIAPDGRRYYPVFPYTSYSRMHASDLLAIKRFLDQQAAIKHANRPHEMRGIARLDALLAVWQSLNLRPQWTAMPAPATAELARGAYLVEAVGHCGECHTARTALGATRHRLWLRGARLPSGKQATNLTPHPDGLAAWDPEELSSYLHTGRTDMGAKARYEMKEFVEHASRFLTEADRAAIAAYLFALPAAPEPAACLPRGPRGSRCRGN